MSRRSVGRLVALIGLAAVALQLAFAARVLAMRWFDPSSTSFERSEAWRLLREHGGIDWHQTWLPAARVSPNLARAVIASEDAGFVDHHGIDWEAIDRAWDRNQRADARAERLAARRGPPADPRLVAAKVVGGSTITQQLAKNLFLAGERNLPRKGQEFLIALLLEACLDKQRILEIYLNHVEWGEGVFGADAAAHRYFGVGANALSIAQASRLAVMLPAPKRFEKRPGSPYVAARAGVVAARMPAVVVPRGAR